MPPTKHMTGNVFAGYLLDAFFNLCGLMTDQSILLVGMMTEGIHTPFLSDRDLALENVRYVRSAAGRLGLSFQPDSFVVGRAHQVLDEALALLDRIGAEGLLAGDRGRDVRRHEAAAGRRAWPRRGHRTGGRLLQPGLRYPRGARGVLPGRTEHTREGRNDPF